MVHRVNITLSYMNNMPFIKLRILLIPLILIILGTAISIVAWLTFKGFYQNRADRIWWSIGILFFSMVLPFVLAAIWVWLSRRETRHSIQHHVRSSDTPIAQTVQTGHQLQLFMQARFQRRWRRARAWVGLLAEEAPLPLNGEVSTAPGWHETSEALLVAIPAAWPEKSLRTLRGRARLPLDGLVWDCGPSLPDVGSPVMQRLLHFNARLNWRLPVSILLTTADAPEEGVSCALSDTSNPDVTEQELSSLAWQLTQQGQADIARQGSQNMSKLAFAATLDKQGNIAALAAHIAQISRGLPKGQQIFRLCWAKENCLDKLPEHIAQGCRTYSPIRHMQSIGDYIGWLMCCVSLLLALGVVVSAVRNHALVVDAQDRITQLTAARGVTQALPALIHTQQLLQQLAQQADAGIPLLSRFGLSLNTQVQAPLFTAYSKAAQRWVMTPVQQQLQRVLQDLNTMPLSGGGDTLPLASQAGFDSLKAYLMLDTPSRTQVAFLSDQLHQRSGFNDQARTEIMRFYAANLAAHPEWKLAASPAVVSAARQTLLGLNGVEHGDETIYQSILQQAAAKYPARTASSLLPGVDSRGLFLLPGTLPGAYTREAWEGYVRTAIDNADPKQGSDALWVMGAEAARSEGNLLKTRLQQRYFNDYAAAWQRWLNGMRWQSANSLSSAVEQLSTYADPQRSPLLALMSMIQYQGQTGTAEKSLARDLLDKTRALVGQSDKAAETAPTHPLARAFGPLLQLTAPDDGQHNNTVSLARYLEAVTSVRLKLQQLAASPNPDAASRQLAQSLFKGEQNALAHGQEYAAMLAASMGAEWAGFAQQLFVSPLESAHQVVMLPAAFDINDLWRRSIYLPWGSQLAGHFPFNATDNDSSIPVLTGFLAPEQGAIARFLGNTLAGALVQEGDQWLPNPSLMNAAPFDADFLNAVNALSRLSSVLYAEGDAGYQFELRPVAMPGLAETTLMIDGQTLKYFNQPEVWVAMHWPQKGQRSATRLQWQSFGTGTQQTLEFNGRWAFIRLLEKARVVQLDKARFQLDFVLPDGLTARYILRSNAGEGPLALLKLLQFKLPSRVFAITGPAAAKENKTAG